ncbi:MAG: hypothetical protein AAFY25_05740 [Pseudomonadota bacterium]
MRTDIVEALHCAFPDLSVVCADTVTAAECARPPRVVLSDRVPGDNRQNDRTSEWRAAGTVFVWTSAGSSDDPAHWLCLARPFTEALLLDLLREVLPHDPAVPSTR